MKIVCPACRAPYKCSVPGPDAPLARASCTRCGASLVIDTKTGEVKVKTGPPAAGPEQRAAEEPEKTPGTVSEGIAPREQKERDYLAVGYVVAVLVVSIVAGFLVSRGKVGDFLSSPGKSIVRWIRKSEARLKERLAEKAKDILPFRKSARDPKSLVTRGYRLYRKGKYKKALVELDKAIKLDPKNSRAYFWRGRVHVKTRRYDEAMSDFKSAVKLDPRYAPSYDNLGWLHGLKNEHDEKIRYLSKSIELNPKNGWAHYNRGRSYFIKGDLERALKDAKKACDLGYKQGCEVYKKYKHRLKKKPAPAEQVSKQSGLPLIASVPRA